MKTFMRVRIWLLICAPGLLAVIILWARGSSASAQSSPALTRGPYLGNQTTTSAQIVWNTDVPSNGSVAYYGGDTPKTIISAGIISTTHVITLSGLLPGTQYRYDIFSGGHLAYSAFTTNRLDSDPNFTFAAIGDSGTASSNQYAVAGLLQRMQPAFVLHTGDVIYPNGDYANFDPNFFAPYSRTLPSVPFFTSMGNHDYGTLSGQPYLDNFYLPSNNPLNTERYYSFDYGNAHFIALDSNQSAITTSVMVNWLTNDLARTTQFWKFVFFHHAIYSSGPHGSLDSYVLPLRNSLAPLFEQYNVDIVFNGHDHDYERTLPIHDYAPSSRGVVYIVTGGGGAGLYPQVTTNAWSAFFSSSDWHAVKVSIANCRLTLQAIKPMNDTAFDSLNLDRCARVYLPVVVSGGIGLIE